MGNILQWHFDYGKSDTIYVFYLPQVQVSESYGLKFPREFALLLKQLLYFDRYTRLLAPNLNMLQDQRISIASNKRSKYRDIDIYP